MRINERVLMIYNHYNSSASDKGIIIIIHKTKVLMWRCEVHRIMKFRILVLGIRGSWLWC